MDVTARQIAQAIAVAFGVLAIIAGIADWRHHRRSNLDRVSWLDWRNVQVYALIGAGLSAWAIAVL